jgi:uncharacterized protein (TIGR00661 family)
VRGLEILAYRWLAPADLQLGLHWFPYHPRIIPPFVQPLDITAEDERIVLVYLPWEDPQSYVAELTKMPLHRFIVYGARSGAEGNLMFKKQDRAGFQTDMESCATVIANAGFALASEALSHGKRLVLKPYAGQPEQEHNAELAESLGVATRISELRADAILPLLDRPRRAGKPFPDMVPLFVHWLERGAHELDADTYNHMWNLPARGTCQ